MQTECKSVVHDEEQESSYPIRVCGDDLLSVTFANPLECQQVADELRSHGDWLESIAGVDSVVVQIDVATMHVDAARALLAEQLRSVATMTEMPSALVEVPVCYGGEFGPDLETVCGMLRLSAEEVVALHSGGEYLVDMLGFTPGFAYVGGLPEKLNVPRLTKPRQRVAAGSVGIADGRSGLYAMAGPGGWSLIGRTPMSLFDPAAEPPFVLSAGTRVRFLAIDADEFRQLQRR